MHIHRRLLTLTCLIDVLGLISKGRGGGGISEIISILDLIIILVGNVPIGTSNLTFHFIENLKVLK